MNQVLTLAITAALTLSWREFHREQARELHALGLYPLAFGYQVATELVFAPACLCQNALVEKVETAVIF